MKKLKVIDKITIIIVAVNMISLLIGFICWNVTSDWHSVLHTFVAGNFFYIVFGIPFFAFIGIVLNITSLINKITFKQGFKTNVYLFILFLLMLPAWQHFFWQALLSV